MTQYVIVTRGKYDIDGENILYSVFLYATALQPRLYVTNHPLKQTL